LGGQREGGFISGPPVPGETYWWASQEATRAAGGAAVEPLVSKASRTMAQNPLAIILRRERER
jgi:hypothetical protein